jgi:hypothetical protein
MRFGQGAIQVIWCFVRNKDSGVRVCPDIKNKIYLISVSIIPLFVMLFYGKFAGTTYLCKTPMNVILCVVLTLMCCIYQSIYIFILSYPSCD